MLKSNIRHPNRYHGFTAKPPFFEGWYYKLVSADQSTRFAIIPGIYLAPDQAKSHCFVQVFDSETHQVQYHRYPFQDFKPSPDSFEIMVGPNYFSANKFELAIDDSLGKLEGVLEFKNITPWPESFLMPGAMGWFAWVPFMECYHGVVSMDHILQGHLNLDGRELEFSGGRGYIEKDWGKRFPSAWIWGQSNHFDKEGVSLMLSTAVVPWLGRSFGGFIIGLLFDGTIHRFATYNRSKIETLTLTDETAALTVANRTHRLKITAHRSGGGLLQAPTHMAMDRRIIETLNARIQINLEDKHGSLLYSGTGQHAGLETVGDLDHLVEMLR